MMITRTFTPEEVTRFFHDYDAIDDLLREIQRALNYRDVDHFEAGGNCLYVHDHAGDVNTLPYSALVDPQKYVDEILSARAENERRAKEKREQARAEAKAKTEAEEYARYLKLKEKFEK